MTDKPWMLRNIARRPIELHGDAAVTVIPADGTIEVAMIDHGLAALIKRGLMTAHPAPPAAPIVTPTPTPRSGKASTKNSRRKGEVA